MNRYIPLDNIFNYISNAVVEIENDDDQLKSWAIQGLRLLNFNNIRNVEDFNFFELKNGNWVVPDYVKKIISVEYLIEDVWLEIQEYIEDNPEFDITYFNINQDKYQNVFKHLDRVDSKSYDYYCKVEDCRPIYTITDNLLQTPVADANSGNACLAVKYWTPYTKDDKIVLPEHPEILWQFLASYATAMHWKERRNRKEQGANQMYKEIMYETEAYLAQSKRELVYRNADIRNIKTNLYAESNMTKLYSFITQYYTNGRY